MRKRVFRVLVVTSLAVSWLLLAGCTFRFSNTQATRFSTEATLETLLQDRYRCFQETTSRGMMTAKCDALNACLAAKGHVRDDVDGNLELPKTALIKCENHKDRLRDF